MSQQKKMSNNRVASRIKEAKMAKFKNRILEAVYTSTSNSKDLRHQARLGNFAHILEQGDNFLVQLGEQLDGIVPASDFNNIVGVTGGDNA